MNVDQIIGTIMGGISAPTLGVVIVQIFKIIANYKANRIKKADMKVLAKEIVDYACEIGAEIPIDIEAEFNRLTQNLVRNNNRLLEKTAKNNNVHSKQIKALHKCVEPLRTTTEENKAILDEAFDEKEEVIIVEEQPKVKLGKKSKLTY